MAEHLIFADPDAASDALTFARRSALVGDGALRLQAQGGTLVMTCAALAPRGLFDATPTVLAMRAVPIDPELVCDLAITASDLTSIDSQPSSLGLPDLAVSPSWAGVTAPRAGWVEAGSLAASILAARAQWGITTVAESLPQNPGEDAVRAVRAAIWGAADPALEDLPLGVAFAAVTLGFIGGEETASLRTSGAWSRVTLRRGHVLVRGPVRSGLTAVRTTGAP